MGLRKFIDNEDGTTIIEHAILSCAVALVIVVAVSSGLSPREMMRRAGVLTAGLSHRTASETVGQPAPEVLIIRPSYH